MKWNKRKVFIDKLIIKYYPVNIIGQKKTTTLNLAAVENIACKIIRLDVQ